MSTPILYIGQDFEFDATLERKDIPHRINDDAIVQAAIYDRNGNILTGWTTYTKNNGADSDWQIGRIAETIPSSELSGINVNSGELRIKIAGNYEDRDAVLGNAYDLSWYFNINIK